MIPLHGGLLCAPALQSDKPTVKPIPKKSLLACMRQRRRQKTRGEKRHSHMHYTKKYTEHGTSHVSHSPWYGHVVVRAAGRERKIVGKTKRDIQILVESCNKESERKCHRLSPPFVIMCYRLTVARPAQDRLPFIQVIPICLFMAHDPNYDAIFRSQCAVGKKNTHERHRLRTLREVHVMPINSGFPTLHKNPSPLHHCSDFFKLNVPSNSAAPHSHP